MPLPAPLRRLCLRGVLAPRRSRRQTGQASLEYAALLGLVATVLAVTAGLLSGGGAIANGVVRSMERAICRVTGDDCLATELAACTVRSRQTGGRLGLKLTLVKLGASLAILREELSDGTVDVTLVDGVDGAPTAGLGVSGGVQAGGDRVGGGLAISTELLLRLGRRRVWHRPNAASADRLVEDLRRNVALDLAEVAVPILGSQVRRVAGAVGLDATKLPPPDVTAVSGGVEGAVAAGLVDAVELAAGFQASLGGSRDRATGRRTIVLGLDGSASGTLTEALGGQGLGRAAGSTVVVTYARDGEPLELATVVAGADVRPPGLRLPPSARGGVGEARVEVTSRLDLRRPANRVAYDRLMAALSPAGARGLPRVVRELAARVRAAGRVDVTRHTSATTTYGADAEAAFGGRIGGAVEVSRSSSELDGAWTRPAGGAWEARTDCLTRRVAA